MACAFAVTQRQDSQSKRRFDLICGPVSVSTSVLEIRGALVRQFRHLFAPAILVGLALAASLAPTEALAQFVCAGSSTGSIPVSGSGSASANQHDVTCGISSVAQGAATGTSGGATSLGFGAFALGANSTSIGSFSGASTPAAGVTSIGANANATGGAAGIYSTGIGASADPNTGMIVQSTGAYSIAIGGGDGVGAAPAKSLGTRSIAIGGSSVANSADSTAVGSNSTVTGANSSSFGTGNTVNGTNSGAFGTGNSVTGDGSFAFGDPNVVNGNGTFVTGNDNNVNAPATAGNGDNINLLGSGNTVASEASASGSAIVGNTNTVNATNAVAIGNGSTVTGAGGISVGGGNTVAQAGAVAIGNGVTTTRANQVSLGNTGNTYTLAGITSADSLAAQSGTVQFVTSDAAGNLATANISIPDISGLDSRVGSLETSVSQLQKDMRRSFEGTALAMAMGGAILPEGKTYAISAGWGTFRGENAFAASGVAKLNDNFYAQGGVGVGARGGVGGRLGLTVAW